MDRAWAHMGLQGFCVVLKAGLCQLPTLRLQGVRDVAGQAGRVLSCQTLVKHRVGCGEATRHLGQLLAWGGLASVL